MQNEKLSIWWWLKLGLNTVLILYIIFLGIGGRITLSLLVVLGQCLVALGALTNLFHYVLLKRLAGPLQRPVRLVTHGGLLPRLRHPMYFGETIMVLGLVLIAGGFIPIALGVLSLACIGKLCQAEDEAMAKRFPNDYEAWEARTGSLWPRIRPPHKSD